MKPQTKKCPICKGVGKQIVSFIEFGKPEQSFESICVTCNGMKKVSVNYAKAVENFWCKCEDQTDVRYVDDAAGVKHHWLCNRCDRVTQVG